MNMRAVTTCMLLIATSSVAIAEAPKQGTLTEEQQHGRALFGASCSYCHGERGHATALLAKRLGKDHAQLEQRTDLSATLIRHVVRHGINSMPWYRRAELTDRELDAIAAYLTRNQPLSNQSK